MSAYKWKVKYDAMLLQFERSEKELAATREKVFLPRLVLSIFCLNIEED